jgi:energy-coupling factor transporter ATP-binding protein EcfA2
MISELKIRNFKSLESVDLKLGHFNLLVGANASGKSNFLDALRFLQGVGNGFTISEILDGKPQSSINLKWDGIRGGSKFVAFRTPDGEPANNTEFGVLVRNEEGSDGSSNSISYSFLFSTEGNSISLGGESLLCGEEQVLQMSGQNFMDLRSLRDSEGAEFALPGMNVLAMIALTDSALRVSGSDFSEYLKGKEHQKATGRSLESFICVSRNLSSMQFLDPLPSVLRGYASKVERLGENGEGFAALIHEIETNGSKPALLEWLRELRPDEVDDIYALEGLNNDFMVAIKEGNKEFRAPVLSEGTLRFIALATAFFQPSMPKVLVIEEIEKGLHPSRLRLLLELMRSQSKRTGTQVFATTHSPTLLAWLTEEDRKTTFVCTRDSESGATKMRSLAEIPRFEELLEEGSHIDELFAEGWLESAPQ